MSERMKSSLRALLPCMLILAGVWTPQAMADPEGVVMDRETLRELTTAISAKEHADSALIACVLSAQLASSVSQQFNEKYEETGDPVFLDHAYLYRVRFYGDQVEILKAASFDYARAARALEDLENLPLAGAHLAERARQQAEELKELRDLYNRETDPTAKAELQRQATALMTSFRENTGAVRSATDQEVGVDRLRRHIEARQNSIAAVLGQIGNDAEDIYGRWFVHRTGASGRQIWGETERYDRIIRDVIIPDDPTDETLAFLEHRQELPEMEADIEKFLSEPVELSVGEGEELGSHVERGEAPAVERRAFQ